MTLSSPLPAELRRHGHPRADDKYPGSKAVSWCSLHDAHPEDCFVLHYPEAHAST